MAKSIFQNIKQIVPHRSPMLMIDSYQKIDSDTAYSVKHFTQDSYGCENGFVIDSMLIESVAQTVAAHYGYKALEKNQSDPDPGMLTNVDTFVFHEKVKDTSKIEIRISKTNKVGAFKLFRGEIYVKKKLVAKGHIKVFNPTGQNKGEYTDAI
ncbi:MAG: hypothetical protein L3J69_12095 [Desulfobacula sp.]|nr:hypothetical protein [Desulfobacula sp.]